MPQTEVEFVNAEQRKHDVKLRRQLASVHKTGEASRAVDELLTINGLIETCPPTADNPYNHLRLTATGRSTLSYLEARLGLRFTVFPAGQNPRL